MIYRKTSKFFINLFIMLTIFIFLDGCVDKKTSTIKNTNIISSDIKTTTTTRAFYNNFNVVEDKIADYSIPLHERFESDIEIFEFRLSLDEKSYSIGIKEEYSKDIEEVGIVSEHNGLIVDTIYFKGFQNLKNLKKLYIPDSIKKIEDRAFSGCDSLEEVFIPGSITEIASSFQYCESLKIFYVEDGATGINPGVIYGCMNVECIRIPDSSHAIDGINIITYTNNMKPFTIFDGGLYLDNENNPYLYFMGLFPEKSDVDISLEIHEGCRSINGITYWAKKTDSGSDSVEMIWPIPSIKSLKLPSTKENLGNNRSYYCNLDQIDISGDSRMYYSMESRCLIERETKRLCIGTESGYIPDGVEQIGSYSFSGMKGLIEVTIPGNVKTIEQSAFENSINLSKITFSDGLGSIGPRAFANCGSIKKLILPSSLTEIGLSCFSGLSGLEEVTIGKGVKKIGARAFSVDSSCLLEKVFIQKGCIRDEWDKNWIFYEKSEYEKKVEIIEFD